MKASKIAGFLGKGLIGKDIDINGVCSCFNQKPNKLAFYKGEEAISVDENVLIIAKFVCDGKGSVIVADNPRLDHARVTKMFFADQRGEIRIGKNFSQKSGVVLAGEGFGFQRDENGVPIRRTHVGGLVIGDNVEVGANSCIDRGTFDNTTIGNNVKIDNLVHIAHNVTIGDNTMVVAGAVVGGGATIGKNCFIGMNCSIRQKVTIGDNVFLGAGSVVVKDIPDNEVWAGNPAKRLRTNYGDSAT